MKAAALVFLLLATLIPNRAMADDYGCTVFLCTTPGAPPWQTIPACVGPVSTAIALAAQGVPWPTCPEAASGASYRGERFTVRLFKTSHSR